MGYSFHHIELVNLSSMYEPITLLSLLFICMKKRGLSPASFHHLLPSSFDSVADSILKREKRVRTRRVHFDNVTVYYFSRRQGFTSVPSQGGSTLGMSNRHSGVRQFSLGEFALEQERIHRDMLRDHLKEEKINSIKLKVLKETEATELMKCTVHGEMISCITIYRRY